MARKMPGRTISRPAQGVNSTPKKPGRWAPKVDVANATPRVVGLGTLSRPAKRSKWAPKPDRAPRIRQS